jgi:uncharacterized protein (TIGR03086 family)
MNDTDTLSPTDPRLTFAKAVRTAGTVITNVTPAQLGNPTPCDLFDTEQLLGHIVAVLGRLSAAGRGEDPMSAPDSVTGIAADGWSEAWAQAAHEVQGVWTDDQLLETIIVFPWATVTGAQTLGMYGNEILVHTWDLAAATGQRPEWDDDVVESIYTEIQHHLPPGDRQAGFAEVIASIPEAFRPVGPPFANEVEVTAEATSIERLVALNGRRP